MNNTKKELVWLPEEIAKKVKDVTDVDSINIEIMKYVNYVKLDLKTEIQNIDEDILLFRARMIQARNSFKEATDAELNGLYEIWETFDKDISKVKKQISEVIEVINPLKQEIGEIGTSVNFFSNINLNN